jgi:GWxTD domain-containing protein
VCYIITDEEKASFKRLTTDDERYQFIESFWLRRDPSPDTIENETRDEHYRRIAYSNERFASASPAGKRIAAGSTSPGDRPIRLNRTRAVAAISGLRKRAAAPPARFHLKPGATAILEGRSLGNEVIIEFVDPTMSGEYRMTMDPSEKDALLYVPNAGLTDMEAMGLASKADRFNNTDGTRMGQALGGRGIRYNQFERLQQYVALQRPPQIKFKIWKRVVNTKISYNLMPFDYRTDFIKITEDTVLTPITIQLQNKDMTFQNKEGVQRAAVNIYGRISTITGRVAQVFEDVVIQDVPESLFKQAVGEALPLSKGCALAFRTLQLELIVQGPEQREHGNDLQGLSAFPSLRKTNFPTSSIIWQTTSSIFR